MNYITITEEMYVVRCAHCSIQFGMTKDFEVRRRKSHEPFFCPAGHPQSWKEESDEEKFRRERDIARQQIARAERDAALANRALAAEKAKASKVKKRASAGVCPCCNRTVGQMARHMKSKHPQFVAEAVSGPAATQAAKTH